MLLADTLPGRYDDLFSPLLRTAASFGFSAERHIGVSLLDRRGHQVMFEHGQLLGCLGDEIGCEIVAAVEAAPMTPDPTVVDDHLKQPPGCVVIGGRRFITWRQESNVRLYAVSAGGWGIAVRKIDLGIVVVAYPRNIRPQLFLPLFEKFCDGLSSI